MRPEPNIRVEQYRKVHPVLGASPAGANFGFFVVKRTGAVLRVISSGSGDEWEHVSVSLEHRCPTWDEMQFVKELFWHEEETVIQFHPKKSAYVNSCEHCLHLWRQALSDYALPPKELIA